MTCPSCNSPLEPTARFCGVCGYKLAPNRPPPSASSGDSARTRMRGDSGPAAGARGQAAYARQPAPEAKPRPATPEPAIKPAQHSPQAPQVQVAPQAQGRAPSKARKPSADDIYINHVLNNRFKVESKIGEGGFGAVYRGVQLATG